MKKCYEKGLLAILKKYYQHNKNIIIDGGIDLASLHGHIIILDWLKKSGIKIKYNKRAIKVASENG